MTFTTTYDFSDFINRTHNSFAGRGTLPRATNPNAFDTLMRIRSDFNACKAMTAITVSAVMNCGGFDVSTEMILAPVGDDGWVYMEWTDDIDETINANNQDTFAEVVKAARERTVA